MVRHQQLDPVGDQDLRLRDAALLQIFQLVHELLYIERHTVSDDVRNVLIEHAGGQEMQGKPTVLIVDGVSRVCASLEADHNVRVLREHVRDLALSFISPVCAYDCLD